MVRELVLVRMSDTAWMLGVFFVVTQHTSMLVGMFWFADGAGADHGS